MRISQSDLVRARRMVWRVVDLRSYDGCCTVTLSGKQPGGIDRTLLTPFDDIERIEPRATPQRVGLRVWRRACRAAIAGMAEPDGLRRATPAAMQLLPYQLEPALAVVSGAATRILVADDVGMGKTVQAGLIVAELIARAVADRVLVIAPAGLRDQWADELRHRFGLDATIADAVYVRRATRLLPAGVNPWTAARVAVTSLDYIKRPDVLVDAAARQWDVVIVDEAHNTVGHSDRHAAVAALAATATYLVLVTATPHNGDESAFASLCSLGATSDAPLLIFRRSRSDAGVDAHRRVRRLLVTPSAAERHMHALLAQFSRAVTRDRGDRASLGLSVLMKRALSSARSLELSVRRRLAELDGVPDGDLEQLLLPFTDAELEGEAVGEDRPPEWPDGVCLRDARRERRLLTALATAAGVASTRESKVTALERLLRRVHEPVLVFTEYRDTLLRLAAALPLPSLLLHGATSRAERRAVVARFGSGADTRLLLATDAAAEGLNLHERCRLVVNLELPWNPVRLEQRIGRVDRIGQRRTVHAVHLIARGVEESRILQRLRRRIAAARRSIDAADPLGDRPRPDDRPNVRSSAGALASKAVAEAGRCAAVRAIGRPAARPATPASPLVSRTRTWTTRAALAGRCLTLWRIGAEDGNGRIVASAMIGIAAPRRAVDEAAGSLSEAARTAGESWVGRVSAAHRSFVSAGRARVRSVEHERGRRQRAIQPGLFDSRTVRASRAVDAAEQAAADAFSTRLAALDRSSTVSAATPELLLVLEG